MATFTGVLSLAGLVAVGFTLHVCAVLSARLGTVARMRPMYRLFWVGIGSCVLALGGRLAIVAGLVENGDAGFPLLIVILPLSIGMTASLAAAWFYWRWLFRE
jgi:hypothetical protein